VNLGRVLSMGVRGNPRRALVTFPRGKVTPAPARGKHLYAQNPVLMCKAKTQKALMNNENHINYEL
jgi:hypothetical protein